ncbi:alanine racemase [Sphingomonas sp.]|jgi:alanine racemase|uniref:alanine racemase n=1 Tax=Sphingomonas sp. TaxID=28214 RepID=UPI00260DB4A8|nr:alanine racemase [Sphingomonas sp.]MDF2494603.1 alanine racemase [Sphingomonas sp.]
MTHEMTYSSELTIDLDALAANYRNLRDHVTPAQCGAVVKADAYGVGAMRVVPALYREGCRTFFVAQLCEAMELRDVVASDCTVVILNGLDPGAEDSCADQGFVPALNAPGALHRWRDTARRRRQRLPAALQFDTGMSRLGVDAAMAQALADDPSFAEEVELRLVMTHLASADEPDAMSNAAQLNRFEAMAALFPGVPRSIANSFGSALPRAFHNDVVRAGIALYGVPLPAGAAAIRPVVSLRARVLQTREIPAGTGVGYGLTYTAPDVRRLATLAIGYADGWPRALSNRGAACHNGVRLPIVGRVSMDSIMVDISALDAGALQEGDLVELIGPGQSLDQVAADAGTIAYEILTSLGRRHARSYLERGITTACIAGDVR